MENETQIGLGEVKATSSNGQLVTGSLGDPRVPISFREHAHSSSIARAVEFARQRTVEEPATEPPAEESTERPSEAPPPPPPTVTPT